MLRRRLRRVVRIGLHRRTHRRARRRRGRHLDVHLRRHRWRLRALLRHRLTAAVRARGHRRGLHGLSLRRRARRRARRLRLRRRGGGGSARRGHRRSYRGARLRRVFDLAEDLRRSLLAEVAIVVVPAPALLVLGRRRCGRAWRLCGRRHLGRDACGDLLLEVIEVRAAEHRGVTLGHTGLAERLDDVDLRLRRRHARDQAIAADALVLLEELALLLDLAGEHFLQPGRERLRREHDVLAHQELLQVGEHLAAPLVAIVDVLRERLQDHALDHLGDVRVDRSRVLDVDVADLLERREVGLALKQALAGQALVKHRADREDVAAAIERQAADLLGRHVPELALEHAGHRARVAGRGLRDAEVDDLDLALVRDEHVLRRAVTVHDLERAAERVPFAVRVVETLEDLGDGEARHRHRHLLLDLAEPVLDLEQILAPDVLHRDEVRAVDPAKLEDLADVRVGELPGDLRLVDEHLDEVAVLAHRGENSLDRDDLLEALHAVGLGLEDLCHPADADPVEQEVFPKWDGLPHSIYIVAGPPARSQCRRGLYAKARRHQRDHRTSVPWLHAQGFVPPGQM